MAQESCKDAWQVPARAIDQMETTYYIRARSFILPYINTHIQDENENENKNQRRYKKYTLLQPPYILDH